MGNDKMREEFEAWYLVAMVDLLGKGVRDQAQKNLAWTRDDGSYVDPALRLALMAWEASHAAVPDMNAARTTMRQVLPNVPGDSLDHALFGAFEAAGLQVTP